MNPLNANKLLSSSAQSLAADTRSLDALKRTARNDPNAALKQAATQFEALFMQMVLKSMRDATPKSGMFDSNATDTYTSMLDQQLAGRIAANGTGLAQVIAKQLALGANASGVGRRASGADDPPPLAPQPVKQDEPPAATDKTVRAARSQAPDARRPTPDAIDARRTTPDASHAQRAFVTRVWDHARAAESATGVPARFIVAQAAHESGWGKHEIRDASGFQSFNLFGIKAGANWRGRTVEVATTEYENGAPRRVVEKFRAYTNYSEAFRDWAQMIGNNPRYAQVLQQGRDAGGFAFGLQRAGYATDPAYGEKLTRVIAQIGERGKA